MIDNRLKSDQVLWIYMSFNPFLICTETYYAVVFFYFIVVANVDLCLDSDL